jgi:hypothetical protein
MRLRQDSPQEALVARCRRPRRYSRATDLPMAAAQPNCHYIEGTAREGRVGFGFRNEKRDQAHAVRLLLLSKLHALHTHAFYSANG